MDGADEVGFALLRIRVFAWNLIMSDDNKFSFYETDGDFISIILDCKV